MPTVVTPIDMVRLLGICLGRQDVRPGETDVPSTLDGMCVPDGYRVGAWRVTRGLDCADTGDGLADAITIWAAARAAGPPLEPASTYPKPATAATAPHATDAQRLAEQGTVHRFARDRRAPRANGPAAAMPYAQAPSAAGRSRAPAWSEAFQVGRARVGSRCPPRC
ncbi:hypothetical protein Psuf_054360 [Phytohabitans suffuscus]|uniref:Uncharacterized protein n=1 Tax=Phytohabitans suffuscus TaxID=624315 RepID=A0A6F8YQ56_9ACTN|nr:hypothetical protein Psuf_054360 [Phytohabitans suffuscus]